MPDVTIVGGGPAGAFTARLLASSGRDVTLLEEHHNAGEPVHCAGVISPSLLETYGVRPKLLGTVTSADVVLPDGSAIHTSKRMPYALIIDRMDFDQKLVDRAVTAGTTVKYGVHYKAHDISDKGVTVDTNVGQFRSDILVGADGQNSVIAASLGNNQVKYYLRGIQVDLKYRSEEEEKMILRLGNDIAPGFFSWQLPLGDTTRFGLAVAAQYGTPKQYLDRLLDNLGLAGKERLKTYTGKIPMGGRRTTYSDRLLLIGDAAGQIKPVSGRGLYPISLAAPALKEAVDRAFSTRTFNGTVLSTYERSWRRAMGKSLSRGNWLREYYDRLDDDALNEFGHLFSRPDIVEVLNDIDIDDPGTVIKPILRKKGVKSAVLKAYLRARK